MKPEPDPPSDGAMSTAAPDSARRSARSGEGDSRASPHARRRGVRSPQRGRGRAPRRAPCCARWPTAGRCSGRPALPEGRRRASAPAGLPGPARPPESARSAPPPEVPLPVRCTSHRLGLSSTGYPGQGQGNPGRRLVACGSTHFAAPAALRPLPRTPARAAERPPRRLSCGPSDDCNSGSRTAAQDAQARVPRGRRAGTGLRHAHPDRRGSVEPHPPGGGRGGPHRARLRTGPGELGDWPDVAYDRVGNIQLSRIMALTSASSKPASASASRRAGSRRSPTSRPAVAGHTRSRLGLGPRARRAWLRKLGDGGRPAGARAGALLRHDRRLLGHGLDPGRHDRRLRGAGARAARDRHRWLAKPAETREQVARIAGARRT